MKNALKHTLYTGTLSISLVVSQAKNTFADGLTELLMFGSEFCRAANCESKVKKSIPEILPKGCRKVYMEIPGNDLFVHSTLVCSCGPQKDISRLAKNVQEK